MPIKLHLNAREQLFSRFSYMQANTSKMLSNPSKGSHPKYGICALTLRKTRNTTALCSTRWNTSKALSFGPKWEAFSPKTCRTWYKSLYCQISNLTKVQSKCLWRNRKPFLNTTLKTTRYRAEEQHPLTCSKLSLETSTISQTTSSTWSKHSPHPWLQPQSNKSAT